MTYALYLTPPQDFYPTVEAAGCYCEFEDKILLLKRHPLKSQGNRWGVPGGKLDRGETPVEAVRRETHEEVGLILEQESIKPIGAVYVKREEVNLIFHRFRYRFSAFPIIKLGLEENIEVRWVTIKEGLELPLVDGGKEALILYGESVNRQS